LNVFAFQPVGQINASIRPPGSKSITNRALICAALANGTSTLHGVLEADDTRYMVQALKTLGLNLETDWANCVIRISGCAGDIPATSAELFVGNSGTSIRFLTALCALGTGSYRLDGDQRMRHRPIGDLVDTLRQLGVNVTAESSGSCPPVLIQANQIRARVAEIKGNVSSQYLSGLMMIAPATAMGLELAIVGELVSQPYVKMTQQLMQSFGVQSSLETSKGLTIFKCERSQYRAIEYFVEPDASAASYFWAAAAIAGGSATVNGLNRDSIQGDVDFVQCLRRMGCNVEYRSDSITVSGRASQAIDIDMSSISDTSQTLAAVALFAEGTTIIRGVAHNRLKETDRIGNLAKELRKLGATMEEFEDGLAIIPGTIRPCRIETYNDHRMAMGLSLVGLRHSGIEIVNPGCTAKTYPCFFSDMTQFVNQPKP
jgi:3-phosphoshikimate 1-carboxyvinyltransferase